MVSGSTQRSRVVVDGDQIKVIFCGGAFPHAPPKDLHCEAALWSDFIAPINRKKRLEMSIFHVMLVSLGVWLLTFLYWPDTPCEACWTAFEDACSSNQTVVDKCDYEPSENRVPGLFCFLWST